MIKNNATISQLKLIPKYKSKLGAYWKNIRHHEIIKAVQNHISYRKWDIIKTNIGLSKNKGDMIVTFDIDIPTIDPPINYNFSFGMINSEIQKRRITLFSGVSNPKNGVVLFKHSKKYRHSLNIKTEKIIEYSINTFEDNCRNTHKEVANLKSTHISNPAEIYINLCKKKIIPWGKLKLINEDLLDKSVWGILNLLNRIIRTTTVIDTRGVKSQLDTMFTLKSILSYDNKQP